MLFPSTPLDDALRPFAGTLSEERDNALDARRRSGLDAIWKGAREQYAGIDEVNRARGYSKSPTLDGPISPLGKTSHEHRSTVFVNITRPYTDSGTAFMANLILPPGKQLNWDLKSTPISETAILQQLLTEFPELSQLIQPDSDLFARVNKSPEEQEQAMVVAKRLIEDWLTECKWISELRKVITEGGKVGTGVLKGPFPSARKVSDDIKALLDSLAFLYQNPTELDMVSNTMRLRLNFQPACESTPVENLIPDPSCGTSIHNGSFVWERIPDMTRRQLKKLAKDETYFGEQILACLKEKPVPVKGEIHDKDKKSYDVWIRTGECDLAKLLQSVKGEPLDQEGSAEDMVYVKVHLCNDRIIKIEEPALDTCNFDYRVFCWEPRSDSWAGIGIPEQIETPQRGLNASVRAGNDNMAWSVGPQILERKGMIEPEDNDWTPHPYKKWTVRISELADLTGQDLDPKLALQFLEFPNYLDKILPWIDFWLAMAEKTTGLSLLLQGQNKTDSVGVTNQLMQSQSTNTKLRVRHFDDDVIEPIIQDFYRWVQLYGPPEAKGDAVAQALGSTALIMRELQLQALTQFLDRVVQPVYGKSPKKLANAYLAGFQLDPAAFDLDDEERQQLEAAANKPDPKVEAEQIRAQTDLQLQQMQDTIEQMKMYLDAQLKGMSLDQAQQAVETQGTFNVAQEQIKHENEKEKEVLKAQVQPKKEGEQKVVPEMKEPSDEEIFNALGV